MTVTADNYIPEKYTGNGATVEFSFDWKLLNEDYIVVILEDIATGVQTEKTLGSDFTLDFDETGGVVTFNTAPTSSYYVIIARDVAKTQESRYTTSDGFQGNKHENSFDKLTIVVQDVTEKSNRHLTYPLGTDTSVIDSTIPVPSATNSGKALVSNEAGDGYQFSTTNVNEIDDAVTECNNAAAAAAVSEANAAASETQTGLDAAATAANVVTTNADVLLTNADVVSTNADAIATAADRVQTGLDATAAANSAAAAEVAKIEWQGAWSAGTYQESDAVENDGSSWIATAITTEEPSDTATDWDLLAQKGDTVSTSWGTITGTLSDQTDLQGELDDKIDKAVTSGSYLRGTGTDVQERTTAQTKTDLGIDDIGDETSLWSGTATSGDVTLSSAFTNFKSLYFVYDMATSTTGFISGKSLLVSDIPVTTKRNLDVYTGAWVTIETKNTTTITVTTTGSTAVKEIIGVK